MTNLDIQNAYLGLDQVDAVYMGEEKVWPSGTDYSRMPLTFEILSDGELYFNLIDGVENDTVEYNQNDGGWFGYPSSLPIFVSRGDIVQFRGENATYAAASGGSLASFFSGNCSYNVYGNIASLIYGENFASGSLDLRNTNATYNFAGMFHDAEGLISCENLVLPFTALTNDCYNGMFKECHNMTGMVQNLPATIVSTQSYRHMFAGCRSLTEAPRDLFIALSGGTLPDKASSSFFYGCSALTKAPILYAESVSGDCYGAFFRNCPALKLGPIVCAQYIPYNWLNFLGQSTILDAVAYYATGATGGISAQNFAPSGSGQRIMYQAGNNVVPAANGWTRWSIWLYDDPRDLYDFMLQELS